MGRACRAWWKAQHWQCWKGWLVVFCKIELNSEIMKLRCFQKILVYVWNKNLLKVYAKYTPKSQKFEKLEMFHYFKNPRLHFLSCLHWPSIINVHMDRTDFSKNAAIMVNHLRLTLLTRSMPKITSLFIAPSLPTRFRKWHCSVSAKILKFFEIIFWNIFGMAASCQSFPEDF